MLGDITPLAGRKTTPYTTWKIQQGGVPLALEESPLYQRGLRTENATGAISQKVHSLIRICIREVNHEVTGHQGIP